MADNLGARAREHPTPSELLKYMVNETVCDTYETLSSDPGLKRLKGSSGEDKKARREKKAGEVNAVASSASASPGTDKGAKTAQSLCDGCKGPGHWATKLVGGVVVTSCPKWKTLKPEDQERIMKKAEKFRLRVAKRAEKASDQPASKAAEPKVAKPAALKAPGAARTEGKTYANAAKAKPAAESKTQRNPRKDKAKVHFAVHETSASEAESSASEAESSDDGGAETEESQD